MTPPRFRAGARLDGAAIRATAERSPRLRTFIRNVAQRSEAGERRAGALLEHIIRRVVDDVGDQYLTNALARLERIEVLRDNIAAILDNVLEGGQLPPGVRAQTLGEYFDHLNAEMRELSRPREAIVGNEPLRIYDDSAAYAESLLREFAGTPAGAGLHVEPTAAVGDAFRALTADQQATVRRAAGLRPKELWRMVSSETEAGSAQAWAELETALGGRLSAVELAELRTALGELGRARNRGLQMSPGQLAEALARIGDPQLRAAVAASGDVWIIQQVAGHNPQALVELWGNFLRRGGNPSDHAGFRAHARDWMVHWGRSSTAEYTAAFSLSGIESFLKGPDANPWEPGIDLIGLGNDGWAWLIDDKSHRASRVSDVSSLTEHLAGNLLDDARRFEDTIADLRRTDQGFIPDQRVLDVIERMREAALEIERIQRTGRRAGRPARIAAELARQRLRLRVTSAMGEVVEIAQALRDIGVDVERTGPVVRLPRAGRR